MRNGGILELGFFGMCRQAEALGRGCRPEIPKNLGVGGKRRMVGVRRKEVEGRRKEVGGWRKEVGERRREVGGRRRELEG